MEEFYTVPQEKPTQPTPSEERHPSLAVDIRREEFVAFSLLQAKVCGSLRRRRMTLVLSVCMTVLLIAFILWDWSTARILDPALIAATCLMLLPPVFSYAVMPILLKRKAEKTYDRQQTELNDSFYGVLTVYPDRVEKKNPRNTVKIPLNGHTLFVETEKMLLVINRYSPTLVLPARCMTEEMTTAVRMAADRLPTNRRVFLARFRPEGQPAIMPASCAPEETLWEQVVIYTPEEGFRVARPVVVKRFWQMAPLLAVISLLGGYMLGWDGSGNVIPFILYFLVCLAALTLFNLVLPISRLKRMSQVQESKDMTLRFRITDKAVYYQTPEFGEASLFWSEISHVYDKGDMVEIEYRGAGCLCIPKRCVEDFAAFSEIIEKCRKNKKQVV